MNGEPLPTKPLWCKTIWGACALSGLAWSIDVAAQLPGSGSTTDMLVPVQPAPASGGARLEVNQTPITSQAPEDTRQFQIATIEIEGNRVFSREELLKVAAPEERTGMLTFSQMEHIAKSIQEHYRNNGYPAASCILPEQDITDGRLRLRVLEGRLVEQKVKNADTLPSADLVSRVIAASGLLTLPVIRQDDLESALIRAGEVAGKKVTAQLGPGGEIGTSRVDVVTEEKDKFSGALMVSNLGDQTTGKTLAAASLRAESLLDHGDQLDVGYSASEQQERLNSYNVKYENSVGVYGWRLGARAWKSNYRIGGALSALQALGTASAEGIYVSYPWVRGANRWADFSAGYSDVNLQDQNVLTGSNPRRSKESWVNLNGWFNDQFWGTAARTIWTTTVTSGTRSFDNPTRRAQDAVGLQTQGEFGLFSGTVSREQSLNVKNWSVYGRVKVQKSLSNNQDSYHKIALGGIDDVRAYATGESTGDEGAIGKIELRYSMPVGSDAVLQLAPFYDRGWVRFNMNPASSTASNSAVRAGHGLETTLVWKSNLEFKAYWARASTGASNIDGKSDRVGLRVIARY